MPKNLSEKTAQTLETQFKRLCNGLVLDNTKTTQHVTDTVTGFLKGMVASKAIDTFRNVTVRERTDRISKKHVVEVAFEVFATETGNAPLRFAFVKNRQ